MHTGAEVRFMIWAPHYTYVGTVVQKIEDTTIDPLEVRATFVFCGEIPRKGMGGCFEVLAGELFVEDEK